MLIQEQKFWDTTKNFKENIEKVKVPEIENIFGFSNSRKGRFAPASSSVYSQYLELINPSMHLAKVTSKVNSIGKPLFDRRYIYDEDPIENANIQHYSKNDEGEWVFDDMGAYIKIDEQIDPRELVRDLHRWCELYRHKVTNKPIYAYSLKQPSGNGDAKYTVYGFVSDRHYPTHDFDVATITKNFFADMPVRTQFYHDDFQMKMVVVMDDVGFELSDGNTLTLTMNVGNSAFGFRSCYARLGSLEKICLNVAMGHDKVWKWSQSHIIKPEIMLRELNKHLLSQLKLGNKYIDKLEEANSINDSIIKETDDLVEVLSGDKFKLLKSEAEAVFRKMRQNSDQYSRNNGFDIGRAIAEVGKDINNLDRRIELETIAGKTMLLQVA